VAYIGFLLEFHIPIHQQDEIASVFQDDSNRIGMPVVLAAACLGDDMSSVFDENGSSFDEVKGYIVFAALFTELPYPIIVARPGTVIIFPPHRTCSMIPDEDIVLCQSLQ
jgi:hypothetical protein